MRSWIRRIRRAVGGCPDSPFLRFAPAGHFYSPLPDPEFVAQHAARLSDPRVRELPGIDLRVERQLELLAEFERFHAELPWPLAEAADPALRYRYDNPQFGHGDAVALFCMLRKVRPTRVIEVGAGFSSAVMLDTDERALDRSIEFTFIEPYPARLRGLLRDADVARCEILERPVQEVPLSTFDSLRAGDVLFIDSSHVAKTGSDVVHLLTHVLPRLPAGVWVHFHDVFWPFEYPEAWLREGRAWNECYVLAAFLQFNARFCIELFNSYLAAHHSAALRRHVPTSLHNPGGSLWLRTTDARHPV